MSERATCPSGLVLDLEPPLLRRLLAYGQVGAAELADACMDRASLPVDLLLEEDAFFVACWAVEHLADDPEAVTLAQLCEHYGEPPSVRLQATDPVLAFELDCAVTNAVLRSRDDDEPTGGSGIAPDDPLYGFPREDE